MTDVIPLNPPKQILVSERDLSEILTWLDQASDTFSQLSVLFKTAHEKAGSQYSDAAALMKIGKAMSDDYSNLLDCERETYEDRYLAPAKQEATV